MPLIPLNREHGWAPYVWLVFLGFFYIQPVLEHPTWHTLLFTNVVTAIFLAMYFSLFWVRPPWTYILLACMPVMGLALSKVNTGSSVFIIYTASFIPWVFQRQKSALIALGVLLAAVGLHAAVFHPNFGFWVTSLIVTSGVGFSNVHFAEKNRSDAKLRMAQSEVEHLAKVAERERIARDLHDVLGHTLSLIIVKSTLADKLLENYPEKAKAEIADIVKVSRGAMAEIRSTLRGYNTYKLCDEIQRAQATLSSAGVTLKSETAEVSMTPAQESVVALIMREAITNVVRHAQASTCRIHLASSNGDCVLEIQDDGRGGFQLEGNGLRGMRERIEALGGAVMRDTSAGTKLRFEFPLAQSSNGTH